ncbi:MAG TPA: sigma-70 family RNA polymerase sigma factor [Actinomycetota bacterium]|nr:sigma-70 family RNA polymerase sigma factor [Actinomycetota bacterium]
MSEDAAGQAGRVGGLESLYQRHASDAVRLAYLLTGDASLAQDVAHEAFVRVGRKLFGLRNDEHAKAYLYRTTVNLCRGRGRRQKSERAAVQRLQGAPPVQPPDLAARDELWTALLTLPVRQRSALFFRYYEDLSEAGAAEALGCSVSALKALVNRGLKELRSQLEGARDD